MEEKKNIATDPAKKDQPITIEFDFEDPADENLVVTGLVFESSDNIKLEEGESVVKAQPQEEETEVASTEEKTEKDEFSIPEEFVINEQYNTPTLEEQTKIWTTYLPRFTGASDNYRMKNDPRPRNDATRTEVKVATDLKEKASDIDPTAEIDKDVDHDSAVVVKVSGGTVQPEGETLNVFKFKSDSVKPTPSVEEKSEKETGPTPVAEPETVAEERTFEHIREKDETPEQQATVKTEETVEKQFGFDNANNNLHIVDYDEKRNTALSNYVYEPDGANEAPNVKEKREFTTHMRRDNFKDKFLDLLMSSKIRIVVGAMLALALLVFENLELVGIDIVKIFHLNFIPGAKVLIDAQLCVCVYLIAFPEIIDSFKHLFRGKLTSAVMLTVQLVVIIAYAIVVSVSQAVAYPLFGFLYSIFALSLLVSSLLKRSADFTAFKQISTGEEKLVLDKKDTVSLELENHALDGAVDEYKSKTVRVFRTTFISDFFKRTGTVEANKTKNLISIFGTLAVSLVVGVVCYFIPMTGTSNLVSGFAAFLMTYLISCPAFALLADFVSYYNCEKTAVEESSAIIGDESFAAYADVDVVTFDDIEIFTDEDVNLKRLMLYGDRENMTKAMRQMSSLFGAVGGPLDYVFSNSLDRKSRPATGVVVEEDGISGIVDGKNVCAGNEEYMSRRGIVVPTAAANAGGADTTKVMYAAEDGQIYAKFDIRYSFSEQFTMIIPTLKEQGIVPLVYTRDPNITNELLSAITRDPDVARVMKKLNVEDGQDVVYRRASSGIVTTGDKINALNVLILSKKYREFKKRLATMEYCSAAVGTVLAAVICFAGLSAVTAVIGAWHVAWCIGVSIVSHRCFIKRKKKKDIDNA